MIKNKIKSLNYQVLINAKKPIRFVNWVRQPFARARAAALNHLNFKKLNFNFKKKSQIHKNWKNGWMKWKCRSWLNNNQRITWTDDEARPFRSLTSGLLVCQWIQTIQYTGLSSPMKRPQADHSKGKKKKKKKKKFHSFRFNIWSIIHRLGNNLNENS